MSAKTVRRLIGGLVCLAVATALAPQAASAKGRVELGSVPPAGLRAGEPWHVDLFVRATARELAAADPPTILIHSDAAGWSKFRATPVPGKLGAYTAAVTFPDAGTWTYHIHDPIAGGGFDSEPVVVAPASGRSALWVAAGSTVAMTLLAGAAFAARLRRRLRVA